MLDSQPFQVLAAYYSKEIAAYEARLLLNPKNNDGDDESDLLRGKIISLRGLLSIGQAIKNFTVNQEAIEKEEKNQGNS